MHYLTFITITFLLPLFTPTALADIHPAKRLPTLIGRDDNPSRADLVKGSCGSDGVDCNNGWCCDPNETCQAPIQGINDGEPFCIDFTRTTYSIDPLTWHARQYDTAAASITPLPSGTKPTVPGGKPVTQAATATTGTSAGAGAGGAQNTKNAAVAGVSVPRFDMQGVVTGAGGVVVAWAVANAVGGFVWMLL